MVGRPADHARRGSGRDDRQLVAQPHALDQPPAFVLGRLEPAGRHVARIHAGRVVDHQHQPPRPRLLPAEDRVGQGQHQKGQERELQQQREQMPQLLPERPRLLLLEDLLPEQQRRDRNPPQADLEDVEDDDRQCQPRQDQRGRVDQAHATAPAARIMRRSSSSKGTSVLERVLPMP